MKKFNRFLSLVVGTSMVLGSQSFAFANDNTSGDVWNRAFVEQGTEGLYEDFPVQINKNMRQDMAMDMSLRYLKSIDNNDSVEITISDASSNDVYLEEVLTSDDTKVSFQNVPNDMLYKVTVDEEIDGVSNEYTKYIKTQFTETDFPVNLKLGDVEYYNDYGDTHTNVLIKKVGDNPECLHDEDEECTEECSLSSVISEIASDELDSFYTSLDANAYYELQTEKVEDGRREFYQGFISTYPSGEYQGIFTRGYNIYDSIDEAYSHPISLASASSIDFSSAMEYNFYQNIYDNALAGTDEHIIKFIPPETGSYTIETIGNADTQLEIYSETDGVISSTPREVTTGGTGENASFTFSILVDEDHHPVRYIVLTLESGSAAPCAFRIIPNTLGANDDITNFRDEVQEDLIAGEQSEAINTNYEIDYNGDVDIFGYNVNTGYGYVDFPNADNNHDLNLRIYYVTSEQSLYDICWVKDTVISGDAASKIEFSEGRHYFEVSQIDTNLPEFSEDNPDYYDYEKIGYSFSFYDPKHKDPYEVPAHPVYGDTIVNPIEITSFPYIKNDLTLHKGDDDYFIFETGSDGGDITITVERAGNIPTYIPHLYDAQEVVIETYDPPMWSNYEDMADYTATSSMKNTLTYSGLEPNHEYYIEIARTNSTSYSSMHPYGLTVELTVPEVPTAVLSGNVDLTHTVGEDITSTDAMLTQVMSSLTCYINGTEVSDTTAEADVELYYNGSALTPSVVNALTAGTYTITAKYQDVAATGGTITLTVSEATSNIAVRDIVADVEYITNYDWLHCAKKLADYRLVREGSSPSTLTEDDVAILLGFDPDAPARGTLYKTFNATCLFYTNGQQSSGVSGFTRVTNANTVSENELFNIISNDSIVIMQLADSTATSDVTKMRYLIICGVNKDTHQLKVYDCLETSDNLVRWIDTSVIFNGGYDAANANVKFLGSIIEVSIN